jgi:hypothetical protein
LASVHLPWIFAACRLVNMMDDDNYSTNLGWSRFNFLLIIGVQSKSFDIQWLRVTALGLCSGSGMSNCSSDQNPHDRFPERTMAR